MRGARCALQSLELAWVPGGHWGAGSLGAGRGGARLRGAMPGRGGAGLRGAAPGLTHHPRLRRLPSTAAGTPPGDGRSRLAARRSAARATRATRAVRAPRRRLADPALGRCPPAPAARGLAAEAGGRGGARVGEGGSGGGPEVSAP